jgi:hypothetical protein
MLLEIAHAKSLMLIPSKKLPGFVVLDYASRDVESHGIGKVNHDFAGATIR